MSLKHLIVHVDGSDRSSSRVALSISLARRFRARLTALFVHERDSRSHAKEPIAASYAEAAATAQERFRREASAAGLEIAWWAIPDGEFEVAGLAARYLRYGDLAILGQHVPGDPVPADLAEKAVLEAGRPVLVIPAGGVPADVGRRVVFAWDGSREAARALNDALPLLDRVEQATVVLVNGPRDRIGLEDLSTPSVLRQLHAHGMTARYEILATGDGSDGLTRVGAVANLAADLSADLVVMGARGRHGSPFPRAAPDLREGLGGVAAPLLVSM